MWLGLYKFSRGFTVIRTFPYVKINPKTASNPTHNKDRFFEAEKGGPAIFHFSASSWPAASKGIALHSAAIDRWYGNGIGVLAG